MKATIVLLMTLLLCASASALPDSGTQRSGNLCEMAHPFKYSYFFSYGKIIELNKTTDFNITFTLWGIQVKRNPHTVDVEVEADGFEVSEKSFQLTGDQKTILVRPLTEKPTLRFKTTLTLDGDEPLHRGYSATYADNFTLNKFNVAQGTLPTSTTTIPGSTSTLPEVTTTQGTSSSTLQGSTTSTVSSLPDTTVIEVIVEQSEPSPVPWYITRAAGLVAYLLLSLSVAIGLLKKMNPGMFSAVFRHHCDISYLALIATFFHMMNTLLDKYQWNLKLSDILLFNFSSNIRIMLSLGILAFYLMLLVTFTSASPKVVAYLKRRRWHLLHLTSYCMYVFVVVHSFILGTDLGNSRFDDLPSILIYAGFWLLTTMNFVLFAIFLAIRKKKK